MRMGPSGYPQIATYFTLIISQCRLAAPGFSLWRTAANSILHAFGAQNSSSETSVRIWFAFHSQYNNPASASVWAAMWRVQSPDRLYDEEYEMLTRSSTGQVGKSSDDLDAKAISSVKYGTESYQSTARLLVWMLCALTGLFLVFTCATVGSSIASNRKATFGISGIMPSINLTSDDCDSLKFANLSLHLFINFLGTLIIAASNYLQQSLLPRRCANQKSVQVLRLSILKKK